ncbi:KANK [Lepeophtheirus salmonis]|uniref:KANK n=1 Tax=Lepeophtheirus salmonis TaxID=72036 RepID=A0A7R8H4U1_LEPSM|nr:KANK [Lepeophtheirus salmonis]CAF2868703.1 KANK [Lepeophtheirus salmonis]
MEITSIYTTTTSLQRSQPPLEAVNLKSPSPSAIIWDLDFLRFCSEELVNGENIERLKDLKRTRRRQRKTLEALMGIKQEQKDREKRLIRDLPHANRRLRGDFEEERRRQNYGDQFMKEALKDAVRDFERCIADTTTKFTDRRLYNNNTFPRSSRDPEDKLMMRQSSNSSISSVSTSSFHGGNSEIPHGSSSNNNAHLQDRMETDSIISISSEMSASTLRNIREQMARSLAKLKDYEKQVEAIPVMQQKELEMTRSLSRNRNNSAVDDVDMLYDTEDDEEEDYAVGGGKQQSNGTSKRRSSFYHYVDPSSRPRARSESPYGYVFKIVVFKEVQILHLHPSLTTDSSCNTESVRMRDHGVNTKDVSTGTRGTNTLKPRTSTRATKTTLSMEDIITREESEKLVQEAVFKTEEELMECPLLQKAMARVEEEVIRGGPFEKVDSSCQPATYEISTQAQPEQSDFECQSYHHHHHPSPIPEEPEGIETVSIGVGDCKVYEDPVLPLQCRNVGVCTEKWVEVIKASKQTDTEDFAYKDTESPRVADILAELPSTPPVSRKGSYGRIGSPSHSRRTSTSSPSNMSTTSTSANSPVMKSIGTCTMVLPLKTEEFILPAPGSPLTTPDQEKLKFNLCDKCNTDIKTAATGIVIGSSSLEKKKLSLQVQPPSPDTPWISKIPRPIPENPDVSKLKSASSTCNLTSSLIEQSYRPRSPLLQRSKSSLTPFNGTKVFESIIYNTSRRIPSPLTRSYSPSEKRSLIPKLSPISQRKAVSVSEIRESKKSSNSIEERRGTPSMIPRVVTPPALRKMYPKESDKLATPDRNVVRKNTYTKHTTGVSELELGNGVESKQPSLAEKLKRKMGKEEAIKVVAAATRISEESVNHEKKKASSYPLPGAALFAPIDENRIKVEPSQEMKSALKVLKDSFHSSTSRSNAQVTNAINIVQQEWFKTSSTKSSNPLDVEDYLDFVEDMSKDLLDRVVNLMDVNGNTALHYSVSHGSFDVVSILLDSKVANPNILNKAGYTCIMLISLAQINNSTHKAVVERLFTAGDVNIRASQHGQTALMLAVSHGRLDMVRLLVEAGGDINVRDEDGSTALMCAAEHGHMEIVKFLLLQSDTNVNAKDNDGLTALAVAMEAGHRDIGVVLYASMSFSRGASPYSSMRMKRPGSVTPVGGKTTPSPVPPTPPHRSRRNSSNQ